jgi:hypothetical protein
LVVERVREETINRFGERIERRCLHPVRPALVAVFPMFPLAESSQQPAAAASQSVKNLNQG